MNNQPKKSFLKKFWWIGLLFLAVISGLVILYDINSGDDAIVDTSKNTTNNPILSAHLPTCPTDTTGLFTEPFMDGDKPDFIIPLGNSGQSGHVVPTDHVYPTDLGYEKNMPVYAPGEMTLVLAENKQMHNKNNGEVIAADYMLTFAPCRGLGITFIHLKTLSEKLKAAIVDENSDCGSEQIDYGLQNGIPTYYVVCSPKVTEVKVSAGEFIGSFSGLSDSSLSAFDIGINDYNKPALAFINPDRYYETTLHTACFTNYYTPELKAKYEAKFGNSVSQGKTGQVFIQRTDEPQCGTIMYDVIGTAAGNWFKNAAKKDDKKDGQTDNDSALVLIHDNIQPSLARLSWENVTSLTFPPNHFGTINREFSEVQADGNVYCYHTEGQPDPKDSSKTLPATNKFLLQLIDDNNLQIEQQDGACGNSESFQNPYTYQR